MSDRKIDLGWIRIFVETVRRGSFSAAANELGLTQPAVSYQIRRLEEQAGQILLNRRRRGVELTPQGRQLFEIASRTVDETDALVREYQLSGRGSVLRLRTDYAFSTFWLMPRISAFRVLNPGVDIQIVVSQRFDAAEMQPGDIAIVFGARGDFYPDAINVLPESVTPVCTPHHLEQNPGLRNAQPLAQAHLIHLDAVKPTPWFDWETYLCQIGVSRPVSGQGDLRFNTYNLVIQAVIEHQGVALGWTGLIDALLRAGVLVAVGPQQNAPDRGYYLVPPSSPNRDAERLVDWLLDETVKNGWLDRHT